MRRICRHVTCVRISAACMRLQVCKCLYAFACVCMHGESLVSVCVCLWSYASVGWMSVWFLCVCTKNPNVLCNFPAILYVLDWPCMQLHVRVSVCVCMSFDKVSDAITCSCATVTISPTHHLRVRIAGLPRTRNVSVSCTGERRAAFDKRFGIHSKGISDPVSLQHSCPT